MSGAQEKATYCYDLDYRNYTSPPPGEVPRLRISQDNKPYKHVYICL
jgi:hypothetical protein